MQQPPMEARFNTPVRRNTAKPPSRRKKMIETARMVSESVWRPPLEELVNTSKPQPGTNQMGNMTSRAVFRDHTRLLPCKVLPHTRRASQIGALCEDEPEEELEPGRETLDSTMTGEKLQSWRKGVHSKGFESISISERVGSVVAVHLGDLGDEDGYILYTVHSEAPIEDGRTKEFYIVGRQEPKGTRVLCIQLSAGLDDPADLEGKGNWATVERRLGNSVPCIPWI